VLGSITGFGKNQQKIGDRLVGLRHDAALDDLAVSIAT
jgi:hypothetical protein